ncbi:MAG: TatD family hydrolase [Clostridia bacterium]
MLIDTHCHLDDERLSEDMQSIILSMPSDGLESVITVGYDYRSSISAASIADKYSNVYATVGIHPHDAKNRRPSDYVDFAKLCDSDKVVALGEIGLDYFYELSDREKQQLVFIEQVELAYSLKMPIIIHLRDAYEDFYKLVLSNKSKLYYGAVLHCYSGSAEYMKQLSEFDFYYGFDGPITYKNARHSVSALMSAPIDRIMFETDSPYLSPEPFRGKTNYPKNVKLVAEMASKILNISVDDLTNITTENAKRLFSKMLIK